MSSTARLVSSAAARRGLLSSRICSPSSFGYLPNLPSHPIARDPRSTVRALAIILPPRTYATETSTRGGDAGPFPPPGFDVNEAKKTVREAGTTLGSSLSEGSQSSKEQDKTRKASPTAADKTKALENASLSEMAAAKASTASQEKSPAKKEGSKTLTLGQRIKKEVRHYWDGTKLLATEVRISSKLALKMAAGYELSRRENRQLQRTTQDLGRLVPFSVFVIVPFAEFLLPVALKLFPNLLPSTFEGQKSREAKAAHLRNTRKQVSSFLRNTLRETGLPVSASSAKQVDVSEFFRKVRATGEAPTRQDVIKVCQTFRDDLTLDNLSRPQLVGMCKYMNLNTFGTDAMLRYQIRHRMRQIKRDDKAISFEGVDSLSVPELQMACASRGLRTHGMSPTKLREDLQMWLDLRLKYNIPSTLLVLSNAYMYTTSSKDSEISSQVDALQAVLSSIPEELFHEIELEALNAEGAATNKHRLEVLREQQELIEDENEQQESSKEGGKEAPKDTENIDDKPLIRTADHNTSTSIESAVEKEAREAEGDGEGADWVGKLTQTRRSDETQNKKQ